MVYFIMYIQGNPFKLYGQNDGCKLIDTTHACDGSYP